MPQVSSRIPSTVLPSIIVMGLGLSGALACGSTGPATWVGELPVTQSLGEPVIGPRDTILVHAANQKDISGEFPVRDDGFYLQPPLGNLRAAGLTPTQLSQELARKLQGMIVNTQISVSIPKRAPIKVHVVGEVKSPATYELDRDRSVMAALAAAGWLSDYAKDDAIFVVRPKEQPPRIRFRGKDLKSAEPHSALFQLRDGDVLVVE
jgi:polysaccharide biosynthesis/export protein